MHRLVKCTGSFDLCKLYPEPEDSPASMEGTAFHEVVAHLIHGTPSVAGSLTSNGIAVTEEMTEGAEMCVEAIPFDMLPHCHVEERVDISGIHPECFGTPDVWFYDPVKKVLNVLDWKFGHGYVEVFENYQLAAYAAGIIESHGYDDQEIWVKFTIAQPRCFHKDGPVRTWGCKAHELRGLVNIMAMACGTTASGQGVCRTGEHCQHCSGIIGCDAAQRAGAAMMDFTARPIPSEMSPADRGLYLTRVKQAAAMLKALDSGLSEEIERSIRAGQPVPGFTLEPGRGSTTWSKPFNEVATLGDMLGVQLRKEALLTPIQATAALKKIGVDETVMFGYHVSTSGALKLAQTDSTMTRRVFGTHKEQ
jgi:hypothetical protein